MIITYNKMIIIYKTEKNTKWLLHKQNLHYVEHLIRHTMMITYNKMIIVYNT